jgi:hypothetical protein
MAGPWSTLVHGYLSGQTSTTMEINAKVNSKTEYATSGGSPDTKLRTCECNQGHHKQGRFQHGRQHGVAHGCPSAHIPPWPLLTSDPFDDLGRLADCALSLRERDGFCFGLRLWAWRQAVCRDRAVPSTGYAGCLFRPEYAHWGLIARTCPDR